MRDTTHLNRDYGNTTCYCAIGANHGNLPFDIRAAVIRHQLVASEGRYTLENLHGDVMVRPTEPRDTPPIYKALENYSPRRCSRHTDREGDGLLISAAAFNG